MTRKYKTGEIAKALGKKTREVARMIDRDVIKGKMEISQNGRGRQSYRVATLRSLTKYIDEHEKGNIGARTWLVDQERKCLEEALAQADGQDSLFGEFAGLVDGLRTIVEELYPPDDLKGIFAGERRRRLLKRYVAFLERHIKLQLEIFNSRK
jgi:hypothetical protein